MSSNAIVSTFNGLALPSKVYAILLVIGSFGTFFTPCGDNGNSAAVCFGSKSGTFAATLVFGALWTWIVELVYRAQWTKTAWLLAVLPIIAGALLLLYAMDYIRKPW
jgi:hypothetical protein